MKSDYNYSQSVESKEIDLDLLEAKLKGFKLSSPTVDVDRCISVVLEMLKACTYLRYRSINKIINFAESHFKNDIWKSDEKFPSLPTFGLSSGYDTIPTDIEYSKVVLFLLLSIIL